jgi:hypothetical protein
MEFVSFYISQQDFKCDDLIKKMIAKDVSEAWIRKLFLVLVRMSYRKKLEQQINEEYHAYMPEDR